MKKHGMIISCIDTETTGLDRNKDRIVQLSVANFDSTTGEIVEAEDWYIKPSGNWTMNPSAQAVHNISPEMIEEKGVSLKSVAPRFIELIADHPILTYNGSSFDISFIQREFEREGLVTNFERHDFIDAFDIERRMNSNKLGDTYIRYFGHPFEDAHNSMADVKATIEVFMEQKRRYKEVTDVKTENGKNVIDESCENVTTMMQTSPEGFIFVDKDGVLKFRIGKYKEWPVAKVCSTDPGYIKWLFAPANGDQVITTITKKSIKADYYANQAK